MGSPERNWQLVAQLLLLSAPKEALREIGLSKQTCDDWISACSDSDEKRGVFFHAQITALALYYANRSILQFKRTYSLQRELGYLPPEVLHSLVQLSNAEGGDTMNGILKEQRSEASKSAVNARHKRDGSQHQKARIAREKLRAIWAAGNYTTRDKCADQEHEALDISRSTAIKLLRNTPNPFPWPAKMSN